MVFCNPKSFKSILVKRVFLFFFIFQTITISAQEIDSLLTVLDKELARKQVYVKKKYSAIDSLQYKVEKDELNGRKSDLYKDYINLFQEYRSFRYDSAYMYIDKAKETGKELKDSSLISKARIKEGFVLISAGLFKEAVDTLNSVDIENLDNSLKYDLYYTKARVYFDLANYNDDKRYRLNYIRQGIKFLEKAQQQVSKDSSEFWAAESFKRMKSQDWKAAEKSYLHWINDYDLSNSDFAIATSSLSFIYDQRGDQEKAIKYLILAAISDIRSATKENTALKSLANLLYKRGDLEIANNYVHRAMEDATFYNARHRKIELSSILPIIEGAQLYKVEQKNSSLEKIIFLLILLAVVTLVFLGIIFKQLKDKNLARRELSEKNERLKETNLNLMETDAIKQDYITYFLRATSQLIHKMDSLQKSTLQKVKTKKPEEILRLLKKYSVKKEREELFHQFDEVFLKLFPSFIEEINQLLPSGEKRIPKKDELLNTELRIFALYRLGVQEPQQVADFLEISVATIYTYKTRLKSRSVYKDDFEKKIMEIKRF